jgi:hypothetical protein
MEERSKSIAVKIVMVKIPPRPIELDSCEKCGYAKKDPESPNDPDACCCNEE